MMRIKRRGTRDPSAGPGQARDNGQLTSRINLLNQINRFQLFLFEN
jgi:hypothetical protein